jgi:hypothetical protein
MDQFSTARLTAERLREDHLADLVALRRYKLGIIGFIDNNQRHVVRLDTKQLAALYRRNRCRTSSRFLSRP